MKTIWNLGLGVLAASIGCAVIAVASAGLGGYTSHALESFPWLFGVSAVPAAIGGIALGWRGRPSWPFAAAVAFLVVVLAGSVGATVVQAFRSGLQSVNILGYFAWSWAYAAALLPVTLPLAYAGARLAWKQNS